MQSTSYQSSNSDFSKKIFKLFKGFKYEFFQPSLFVNTDYLIERSGENFRDQAYSFQDEIGKNFSLRTDLTLSVCLNYIKNKFKAEKKFFYFDDVFRKNRANSIVTKQLGCEIINSSELQKSTLDVFLTIFKSLKIFKKEVKNFKVQFGDIKLFEILIENIDLPERWKLRLKKHFCRINYFEDLIQILNSNQKLYLKNISIDKKKYLHLKKFPKKNISGRQVQEILDRFESKINDPRDFYDGKKAVKIIKGFLRISCRLSSLKKNLESFCVKNNLRKDLFEERISFFDQIKKTIKQNNFYYSSQTGRDLEYYTGYTFQIVKISNKKKFNLARGGNYDNLFSALGSKKKIPAVGGAINLI